MGEQGVEEEPGFSAQIKSWGLQDGADSRCRGRLIRVGERAVKFSSEIARKRM